MPQWGLTDEHRGSRPWGIDEDWLAPDKVITDPVHGDIYLTRLERAVVDSSPFQRLRRIRQLGTVHLVYPGATHTRFSHSLGAMRVVQDLLDIVLAQRSGRHASPDLFRQWEEALAVADAGPSGVAQPGDSVARFGLSFDEMVAEAIVLARLGALLHDLCHVAYGHSIEDDLMVLEPHDANVRRYQHFWRQLGDGLPSPERRSFQTALTRNEDLRQALRPLILSKEKRGDEELPPADVRLADLARKRGRPFYPFVADMVGNTICADLLDYLQRDHLYAGLPASLGQRFMTAFYVVPAREQLPAPGGDVRERENVHYPERMALHIARDGRERKDIASELLKHLRYRYELQERVIVHHAKLAADGMLGKLIGLWQDAEWIRLALATGGEETHYAAEVLTAAIDQLREAYRLDQGEQALGALDLAVRDRIEDRLRVVGDDGLLEYLGGLTSDENAASPPGAAGRSAAAVRALARDLLSRRLYKRAAEVSGAAGHQKLYDLFGADPRKRRDLERQAADYAGVNVEQVVLWLPEPKMRAKIAKVLVDYGTGIAPFEDYYHGRGEDIYASHRQLWTITIYLHPELRGTVAERRVVAKLAQLMGVEWDRHRPKYVSEAVQWPLGVAIDEAMVSGRPRLSEKEAVAVLTAGGPADYRGEERRHRDTSAELGRRLRRLRVSGARHGD